MLNVQVIQPVVPHYRLPFFAEIVKQGRLQLSVHASESVPNNPSSVGADQPYVDLSHDCLTLAGGRLHWQRRLALGPEIGAGDVLVIDGNPRFLSSLPLALAARRRGAAVVWWGHGWSATSHPVRAGLRLAMMRRADLALAYTEDERRRLIERGFDPERVHAINNTIDQRAVLSECARWSAERLAHFRQASGIEGRKILLFCGRLKSEPSTELDEALEALRRLVAHDDSHLLAVIGDGDDAGRLRQVAERLRVDAHVRWLGSMYGESALAPWFLSATALVHPGPIGLSLLHAFAYGLPVVTHDERRAHNPEIAALEHGLNGYVYQRYNPGALAYCLQRLGADEALRRRVGERARQTVLTDYSIENMVERFHRAMFDAARLRSRRPVDPSIGPAGDGDLRSVPCE